jgi:ABC-type branched-subunit amino acid transport system substrate-binding protein
VRTETIVRVTCLLGALVLAVLALSREPGAGAMRTSHAMTVGVLVPAGSSAPSSAAIGAAIERAIDSWSDPSIAFAVRRLEPGASGAGRATSRLIDEADPIALIVACDGRQLPAIEAVVRSEAILCLSFSPTSSLSNMPWTLELAARPNQFVPQAAAFAADALGPRLAIVSGESDSQRSLRGLFIERAVRRGATIVADCVVDGTGHSLADHVQALREAKPSAIVIASGGEAARALLSSVRAEGIIAAGAACVFLAPAGAEAECADVGDYVVTCGPSDPTGSTTAAHLQSAIEAIRAAMSRSGAVDGASLRTALTRSTRFGTMSFDPSRGAPWRACRITRTLAGGHQLEVWSGPAVRPQPWTSAGDDLAGALTAADEDLHVNGMGADHVHDTD